MSEQITQQLKQKAAELGFNRVGIIPAEPSPHLAAYLRWVAQEYHGEMGYLARPDRVARRQDLNIILPGVRSLVCVGLDYSTVPIPAAMAQDPSRGRISNYAWGQDYHQMMTPRLEALAAWLRQTAVTLSASAITTKVYVDTGALLERDHAARAGFGFSGKNTMLIAPRHGSWFFLGELLTTLPLQYDTPPKAMPHCGKCTACLTACPTQAFPTAYTLDARRCISYLTIEHKGWIPRDLRPLMGNWVYGCDVCQEVCPFTRFVRPASETAFYPANWDFAAPPLLELLQLDEAGFEHRFAHSPIRRIKRERLMRNACVAAGNWGQETAVPLLAVLLHDPSPLVRGHAAWALGQIASPTAQHALITALPHETDPIVHDEISSALTHHS